MNHVKALAVLYWLLKCVEGHNNSYLGPNHADQPARSHLQDLEIDLDGAVDTNQVELRKLKPYDIDIQHYNLRDGYRLAKLRKSEQELWINSNNLECRNISLAYDEDIPILLSVTCEQSDRGYYFVNDNNSWRGVRDQFFYALFNDFVLERTGRAVVEMNLAQEQDEKQFYVNKWEKFPFVIIVPNVSVNVNRILEGTSLVWEAPSRSSRMLYLSLYKGDYYSLICLITKLNQRSFYARDLMAGEEGGGWRPVEESEYTDLLARSGVDLSKLQNKVTLNLSSPDKSLFIDSEFGSQSFYLHKYSPRPGLMLTTVSDANSQIWASDTEYCSYVGVNVMQGEPTLMILYIKALTGAHSLAYFHRNTQGSWLKITEHQYHHYMTYGRLGGGTLYTLEQRLQKSSFTNKQGLKIQTYFSPYYPADANRKGTFVLVHGNREYFMSNFLTYDALWNYRNFGFPSFPHVNSVADFELYNAATTAGAPAPAQGADVTRTAQTGQSSSFNSNTQSKHDEYFGDEDMARYSYDGSFVQVLNGMGYDVYGLDLQSFGLSESATKRCYVEDFGDFVDDLLQFVDLLKRGQFNPPPKKEESESEGGAEAAGAGAPPPGDPPEPTGQPPPEEAEDHADDDLAPKMNALGPETYTLGTGVFDDSLYLLGYSMGANVVLQAVQKFNKNTHGGVKFVNGVVSLSGMAKLDHVFTGRLQKMFSLLSLGLLARLAPKSEMPSTGAHDWTANMSYYLKLCDGYYYSESYTYRLVQQLFKATDDLQAGMINYPRNLPTLFIHTKDDTVCSIKGVKRIYKDYIEGWYYSDFVELKGNSHDTPNPQMLLNILPGLRTWLDRLGQPYPKTLAPPRDPEQRRGPNLTWESVTYEIVLFMILSLFLIAAVIFGVLNLLAKRETKLAAERDEVLVTLK